MDEYDIILHTLFSTDNPYSCTASHLAKEFSKNNRVFYINRPYSIKDLLSVFQNRKIRKRGLKLLTNQIQYEYLEKNPTYL